MIQQEDGGWKLPLLIDKGFSKSNVCCNYLLIDKGFFKIERYVCCNSSYSLP